MSSNSLVEVAVSRTALPILSLLSVWDVSGREAKENRFFWSCSSAQVKVTQIFQADWMCVGLNFELFVSCLPDLPEPLKVYCLWSVRIHAESRFSFCCWSNTTQRDHQDMSWGERDILLGKALDFNLSLVLWMQLIFWRRFWKVDQAVL